MSVCVSHRSFTRGRAVDAESMRAFVEGLEGIPDADKQALLELSPETYIGIAPELARGVKGASN